MNCKKINKKIILAVLLIAIASVAAVNAWSTYVVFNDSTYVTSAHLNGKTSYNVGMDVDGASGLSGGHVMVTTIREDVPLLPDKTITSWSTSSDYNTPVSGLSSSKTYYAVWDMTGTGGVQYGTLSFV